MIQFDEYDSNGLKPPPSVSQQYQLAPLEKSHLPTF